MGLTRDEQEFHVNYTYGDKNASLYTSIPHMMDRIDKLCKRFPDTFKVKAEHTIQGEVIAKTYEYPVKLASRIPTPRPPMSEERKQESAKRLAEFRKNKKED